MSKITEIIKNLSPAELVLAREEICNEINLLEKKDLFFGPVQEKELLEPNTEEGNNELDKGINTFRNDTLAQGGRCGIADKELLFGDVMIQAKMAYRLPKQQRE